MTSTADDPEGGSDGEGDAWSDVDPDGVLRRLRLALDVSKIGVFEADLETGHVLRDAALMRIYGYDGAARDEAGELLAAVVHPDDRETAFATIAEGTASGETFFNAFRIIRPDGAIRHIRSRSVTFRDAAGHRRLLGANWDVSDDIELQQSLEQANDLSEARYAALERAWHEIERQALHDQLTGLLNRSALLQWLGRLPAPPAAPRAVLHIDLSRFKEINDTLGHKAGDAVIVHVSRLLDARCSQGDVLARIGGDEFALVLDETRTPDDADALMDAIVAMFDAPIPCEGHLCRCGVSIGMAWTGDGIDGPQALINAAIALSAAKAPKGSRRVVFTPELENHGRAVKQTADDILEGLATDAFLPFYQLQFDARTLKVCGAETLVRWQHPRHGLLAPERFLKIAEDIDVMWRIDRVITAKACADLADWRAAGLPVPRLSINVSARRLLDPELLADISALDLPAGTFAFEMLESIFLDAPDEEMAAALARIRAAGIGIEIDDFGTGHASILGLTTLHPARLKIDRALITPMTGSETHRRLIAAVIEMGHALDIGVVAEGVETRDQIDMLREMGCDVLQGYALARPLPRDAVDAFLRSTDGPPAKPRTGADPG